MHTIARLSVRTIGPIRSSGWLSRIVVAGLDMLMSWNERARQRHHLAMLDDHHLADMGLSRADVEAEISKPFWRL